MRILMVADAVSMHTRRWVEALVSRGHDVHVASFRYLELEGATFHQLPNAGLKKAGYFLAVPALWQLARRIYPDVVHAQYVTSYGFLAAMAGLRPLVVTAWGTDVLVSPWESRIYKYFAKFALIKADIVTTVAEHMNRSVEALGIPSSKIQTMPFGVDTEQFVFRQRSFSKLDRPWRIISTRNFESVYDIRSLIAAADLLHKKGLAFHLTLVGDGSLTSELQKFADQKGLTHKITFAGRVDHRMLPKLLAEADIFVTPAHSDGNNISLNEAMSVGCFPIATNIPANAQWLRDGENGYLYPAGDETALAGLLSRAIANPHVMERAVSDNRNIIEERANWKHCVTHMENLFRNLTENK